MPIGVYKRTDIIKQIQSEKAIKRWKERKEELLKALEKRDLSKSGRPRTFERISRKCYICENIFEIKNSQDKQNKKFCSSTCYKTHQKNIGKTEEFKNRAKKMARSIDRSYMQTNKYKQTLQKLDTPAYKRYKNRVYRLTEKTYVMHIKLINPEMFPRTLCGVDGGYQLDHIKSIRECFNNGVSPEEASDVANLRMLPWKLNLMRNYS